MNRKMLVNWLRLNVPPERWVQMWWLTPIILLLALPVGALVLRILGLLGWDGVGRATQALILLSVVASIVVGSFILWSVEEAELEPRLHRRVQWLARFAVVGPILTLGIMFWIAKIT